MFLRGLAKCFREAEGREKMLAARWSANILLVLICVALLLDFCSCAKVPKETAAELDDFLSEDFNNGFANGAFAQNTEKLAEDDGENVEDENGWAEEEEDEDEIENEDRDADDEEEGEEESENRDENDDEDDNDLDEDENGERNEIEGQDEYEDGDVDDTSDLTAMEDANEAQVAVRENEGKVFQSVVKEMTN